LWFPRPRSLRSAASPGPKSLDLIGEHDDRLRRGPDVHAVVAREPRRPPAELQKLLVVHWRIFASRSRKRERASPRRWLRIELEPVAGHRRHDHPRRLAGRAVRLERLSELGDADLERLSAALGRRPVAPERLEQPLAGNCLARLERQHAKQGSLFGAADRHDAAVGANVERPKDSHVHPAAADGSTPSHGQTACAYRALAARLAPRRRVVRRPHRAVSEKGDTMTFTTTGTSPTRRSLLGIVLALALAVAFLAAASPAKASSGSTIGELALAGPAAAESEPIVVEEPLRFVVDTSLEPASGSESGFASIAAFDGHADFVPDQLIVATEDEGALNAFLERWQGQVVETFDPHESGLDGLAPQYTVRIDPRLAEPDRLEQDLQALGVEARGTHRVSSEEGLRLLAAAAEAARDGLVIGVNWIAQPATIRTRSTAEAPVSSIPSYTPNAYAWPHICNGVAPACPQDLGVGEAWNLLARAGRLASQGAPRIPIAILDGGFAPSDADTPPASAQLVSGANPFLTCGGNPCPFHGSNVSDAATALADNQFGAAGSAGPVASTIEFGYGGPLALSTIVNLIGQVNGAGQVAAAPILNMSFSISLDASFAWTLGLGDAVLTAVRATGKSLFAAAGNNGLDVDVVHSEPLFGNRWEAVTFWPCETPVVVCVGGLGSSSKLAHSRSNFGTGGLQGSGTVDVFGPFSVFVGPDGVFTGNAAQQVNGTSFASPFVAGITALVMAANPSLTAAQAESVVLANAFFTCSKTVTVAGRTLSFPIPCVDAERAVRAALANIPPDVRIVQPTSGSSHPRGKIRFTAIASDEEDGVPTVTWFLCGRPIGTGLDVVLDTYHCPFGPRAVTAVASDSFGWNVGDADSGVTFSVSNTAPTVSITKPANRATFYVSQDRAAGTWSGETISLEGASADPNNASGTLSDSEVKWILPARTITGHQTSINALDDLGIGTHTISLEGTDDGGLATRHTVTIEVKEWQPQPLPCKLPC
jgi:serine protease